MERKNNFFRILLVVTVLALCGCGNKAKPEDVVRKYSESMKTFDIATSDTCFEDASKNTLINPENAENEYEKMLKDYLLKEAQKITYEITNVETGDATATVTANYHYTDITPVINDSIMNYIAQAIMVFGSSSEDELSQLFIDCFNDSLDNITVQTAECEVKYNCILADGQWKIDEINSANDIPNIVSCNLVSAFSSLDEILGTNSSNDKDSAVALNAKAKELSIMPTEVGGKVFYNYFNAASISSWVKVQNTSDCDVKLTDICINYIDKYGRILGSDHNCKCIPESLKPGEYGFVYSYHYELGSKYSKTNGVKTELHYNLEESKETYTVDVKDATFKEDLSGISVKVSATNNSEKNVDYCIPGAVFFDESGNVLGFCYGIQRFDAGQTTTFEISGDLMGFDDDISKVSYVEVYIQGDND